MSNEEGIKWAAVPPPQKKHVPTWVWIVVPIVAVFMICDVAAAVMGNDSPAPIPNSSAGASSENVFHYGQTAAVGKFAVTLTPIDYTPSEGRAESGTATAFQVTVRNDGQGTLDLFSLMFRATIDGGQPADQIFDSGKGIKGVPSGELFPTESATFKIAFDGTVSRVKVEGFLDFSDPVYFVP
jgi:hypothetical protein